MAVFTRLRTIIEPFYFTDASGKLEVPSRVGVVCATGEVLFTFQYRTGLPS